MLREVLSAGQVASKLQSLRGTTSPVLLLFFATKKADGTRWCPDCEEAEGLIEEAAALAPAGLQLYTVELTREEWKVDPGQAHYLRKSPFEVAGIPTLLHWDCEKGAPLRRFNESDLSQLESLTSFFAAFNETAYN